MSYSKAEKWRLMQLLGFKSALNTVLSKVGCLEDEYSSYHGGTLVYPLCGGEGDGQFSFSPKGLEIVLYPYSLYREDGQYGIWLGERALLPEKIVITWSKREVEKLYKTQNQQTLF